MYSTISLNYHFDTVVGSEGVSNRMADKCRYNVRVSEGRGSLELREKSEARQ